MQIKSTVLMEVEMSQLGDTSIGFDRSAVPAISGSSEVMVGTVAVIFLVIVAIFFVTLYLYAKHVWAPRRALRRRRSQLVFTASDPVSLLGCGLSSTVLKALPVTVFHVSEERLECAVCLCELNDGEQVRMLPKCNHGFHLECIDMWFQSHSTCPLCRNPVEINETYNSGTVAVFSLTEPSVGDFLSNMYRSEEPSISPAGGTCSSSVSTSINRERELVIDIPRLKTEELSLPSTSLQTSEATKTPISARRRTLMRFLSRGKRTLESPSTKPGEISGDIEQGQRGAAGENGQGITPRIPRSS